ncbi:MAG: methylmalonyl Co-A mutase-associated GTPase MeaB [Chloroflexota bacterium]
MVCDRMTLSDSVLSGDRLALSRLLTQVENDTPEGRQALAGLFPHAGRAHLIGVTGAPGTGKSSLVSQLALAFRRPGNGHKPCRVAVIAVDPSSPFTGGAILGDRVRMRELSGDPGVFIRSMAARGSLGGLSVATSGVVQVFDAAGYDVILIETVGAGQSEVDIARLAHTTIVVEAPGLGDDIQAIKAGILEVADILVVNKADRPGADNTARSLRNMLELAHPVAHTFHHRWESASEAQPDAGAQPFWLPPVQLTAATQGTGIRELVEAIGTHREHLERSGEWRRRERQRLESELEGLLHETLVARWRAGVSDERYHACLEALLARRTSPYEAVEMLLKDEIN